jgi:xyloglucan-specific endo-beta-1,4-glucanase
MVAKKLSAISSIPSTWSWTYTGSNLVADVAYDLFTSTTATGSANYEIMIWLAAYGGAGAISSSYGSDGKPVPVAKNVNLNGHTWNLYKGPNGSTTVFSFLPTSGTIASFSGDVNLFLKYLTAHEGLAASNYLNSFGAGTEPTSGEF